VPRRVQGMGALLQRPPYLCCWQAGVRLRALLGRRLPGLHVLVTGAELAACQINNALRARLSI